MNDYIVKKDKESFLVCEDTYNKKPYVLETCNTEEDATKCVKQWIARDSLTIKVESFTEQMIEEYNGYLEEDEIRKMIKGG